MDLSQSREHLVRLADFQRDVSHKCRILLFWGANIQVSINRPQNTSLPGENIWATQQVFQNFKSLVCVAFTLVSGFLRMMFHIP